MNDREINSYIKYKTEKKLKREKKVKKREIETEIDR